MLNLIPHEARTAAERRKAGLVVWFTGLSGSGKTTICGIVAPLLCDRGYEVEVLDADEMRRTICRDLGFSKADRDENIFRIGGVARSLADRGYIVLVAAISPYRQARTAVRRRVGRFMEVYVDASLAACIQRDPKQLYARALSGTLRRFTGIDDPYEPPLRPDLHCKTDEEMPADSAAKVVAAIERRRVSPAASDSCGQDRRSKKQLAFGGVRAKVSV